MKKINNFSKKSDNQSVTKIAFFTDEDEA